MRTYAIEPQEGRQSLWRKAAKMISSPCCSSALTLRGGNQRTMYFSLFFALFVYFQLRRHAGSTKNLTAYRLADNGSEYWVAWHLVFGPASFPGIRPAPDSVSVLGGTSTDSS